jgi:hypothetical protein
MNIKNNFIPQEWLSSAGLSPQLIAEVKNDRFLSTLSIFLAIKKNKFFQELSQEVCSAFQITDDIVRRLGKEILAEIFTNPIAIRFCSDFPIALGSSHFGSERIADEVWLNMIYDINRVVTGGVYKAGLSSKLICKADKGYLHIHLCQITFPVEESVDGYVEVLVNKPNTIEIQGKKYHNSGDILDGLNSQVCMAAPYFLPNFNTKVVFDDITLNHHWIHSQVFPYNLKARPVSSTEVLDWVEEARRSFVKLDNLWPEMGREIIEMNSIIVPVNCANSGVSISCSSDDFWGAILISQAHEDLFGESLVHEHSHNVMYAILKKYPLLKSDGLSPVNFYSPWRPDARPIYGILHAVYVFDRVCEYYLRLIQKNPTDHKLQNRLAFLASRIRIGIVVIHQCGDLTDEGEMLMAAILDHLDSIPVYLKATDWKSVKDDLRRHYKEWCESNPTAHRPEGIEAYLN